MFNVNKCKQFLFSFQRQMYQFISKLRIRNFKQIVNRILRMCEFVFFFISRSVKSVTRMHIHHRGRNNTFGRFITHDLHIKPRTYFSWTRTCSVNTALASCAARVIMTNGHWKQLIWIFWQENGLRSEFWSPTEWI